VPESIVDIKLQVGDVALPVLSYHTHQELCSIDKVCLVVDASTDLEIKPAKSYIKQKAKLAMTSVATNAASYFHGTVVAARYMKDQDDVQRLELDVEGPLYGLLRTANSTIFQDKSLQTIASDVAASVNDSTPTTWMGPTDQKKYVVQYDESNLSFFHRTLAEDGMAWFARHTEDQAEIFFVDAVNTFQQTSRTLDFRTEIGTSNVGDFVSHARMTHRILPDRARVSGYDPHHPHLAIEKESESAFQGSHTNEIYSPESRRPVPDRVAQDAKTVVESYDTRRTQVTLITSALGLQPGDRINLESHPYAPLNGEYLLVCVEQEGSRARLGAFDTATTAETRRVEVVGALIDKPWQPARLSAARKIAGPQTAMTTGDGEEIYTNEHGEVTTKFHWDRDGKADHSASRFMRTSQIPTGGSMLLPRVGWEVLVAYQEGDVDQPMVMSRLYNGGTMPPYKLPDNALKSSIQTASTPGDGTSNEIRMSDTKGDEQMMFNASRDMSIDVGNNTTQSIGNDLAVEVGADQSITVIDSVKYTVGSNQICTISGNQKATVGTLSVDDVSSDHSASVGGNRMQMIGGDHRRTVEGSCEVSVAGSSLTAVLGAVSMNTAAGHDHKVGAALIEMAGGDRSVIAAARSETTGGAKVLIVQGNRAVEAGSLAVQVGGAVISKVDGDRSDKSELTWSETAGGQQKVEAKNITIEADIAVTLTMGGASVAITPSSISVTGASIKIDGKLIQSSALNLNN